MVYVPIGIFGIILNTLAEGHQQSWGIKDYDLIRFPPSIYTNT
jgi:hypothetical protein